MAVLLLLLLLPLLRADEEIQKIDIIFEICDINVRDLADALNYDISSVRTRTPFGASKYVVIGFWVFDHNACLNFYHTTEFKSPWALRRHYN